MHKTNLKGRHEEVKASSLYAGLALKMYLLILLSNQNI